MTLRLALAVLAGLAPAASAALPDFPLPSPEAALARGGETPALEGVPLSVLEADPSDGRTLNRSRSKPSHRFDLSSLAGSYALVERADAGKGCIQDRRTGDDAISVEVDHRVSERSWAPDDHFESLNVRTPDDYVLDFVSDIDQGPMQYTRHDVENPTLGDVVGCVAWYGNLGIGDAYRYCRDHALPKPQPEPDFNPSYFYWAETATTADGELIQESLRVVRPSAEVTLSTRKTTSLKLSGGTLTVTKLSQENEAAPKTLQRCVYRKL